MSEQGESPEEWRRHHRVKLVALYAGTVVAVGSVFAMVAALNASYVNHFVLRDVKLALADTRNEIRAVREEFHIRADADSIRFERVMNVVELAVVALVEEPGSDGQRSAVMELRKMRHVTNN
jgi:hypothetical protein